MMVGPISSSSARLNSSGVPSGLNRLAARSENAGATSPIWRVALVLVISADCKTPKKTGQCRKSGQNHGSYEGEMGKPEA